MTGRDHGVGGRSTLRQAVRALGVATAALAGLASADLPIEPEPDERWVLVDTDQHDLVVYTGEQPTATFNGLAIGRGGVSEARTRGDRTTPLGEFRIDRIHDQSQFRLFLGLDYPRIAHADAAFREGRMKREEYREFLDRTIRNGRTPQDSSLGGHIGIHGLGDSDEDLHRVANWTDGCIALDDAQIEALSSMVGIGTRVIIR